jgi:protein-disulfide isomerase
MTEQHAAHTHAKKDMSALYVPIAIVVAGLIIAGAVVFTRGGGSTDNAGQQQQKVAVDITKIKTDGQPFIGNANAPVTLAYWADYQCPFCKKFEEEVLPSIISKYVDTGKVKVVFKDFAFLGNDSIDAASYEHAVWELYPDQFFAWRTDMFKHQDDEGDRGFGNAGTIDTLIKDDFAGKMDDAKVKALVAEKKDAYAKDIQTDMQEGGNNGISGTPGFITGKSQLVGYSEFPSFQQIIDPQLK